MTTADDKAPGVQCGESVCGEAARKIDRVKGVFVGQCEQAGAVHLVQAYGLGYHPRPFAAFRGTGQETIFSQNQRLSVGLRGEQSFDGAKVSTQDGGGFSDTPLAGGLHEALKQVVRFQRSIGRHPSR